MANENKQAQTEEERKQQLEDAGLTQDQQQAAAAEVEANAETFAVGDRVTIVTDTPNGQPLKGTVRVVNSAEENPGQQIGIELDEWTATAHSLEGVVEEREQGGDLPVIGKGWWTRPENLDKLDS